MVTTTGIGTTPLCPFVCSSSPNLSAFSTSKFPTTRKRPTYPSIRAADVDQATIVAISVGVFSVAIGIGIPIFYETQIDNARNAHKSRYCLPYYHFEYNGEPKFKTILKSSSKGGKQTDLSNNNKSSIHMLEEFDGAQVDKEGELSDSDSHSHLPHGNWAKRDNTQPCFPCNGSGAQKCRFCLGTGNVTVELGGDEKEVSKCINCDGLGSLTCTTCQGSGIQPRYLDRREFKDDD